MNKFPSSWNRLHLATLSFFSALLVTAVLSQTAFAQGLTYVDADDFVNLTTSSGDPISVAVDQFSVSTDIANDDLWRYRGDGPGGNAFGASGSIYEADNTEDAQELIQTVSGLSSGTSYDMYGVWWSATGENWVLRGGLTSNPGANTLYDRTGAAGTPGQLGVFTNWTAPPADNINIADGFTGIEAATVEGNRVMLVAKIGTATANGSGQVQVFVDDALQAPGANRGWYDGVAYAPVGANASTLSATVDRTTGILTLNSSANVVIDGISILSGAGGLDSSGWTPVTGNLDAGGNSSFDNEAWEIVETAPGALREAETRVDPETAGNGATLGPGGVSSLNLGSVWVASPFEDMIVNLRLNSSQFTVPVTVDYVNGAPSLLGDFDNDSDLDIDDYRVVLRGMNQSFPGSTDVESYAFGDLTGNQATNFNDLARFRELYDDANGVGAFAAMVPEPSSFALLGLGGLFLFRLRRRRGVFKGLAIATLCVATSFFAPSAEAQITYIDSDEVVGGNTAGLLGGWATRGNAHNAADANNFGSEGATLQATAAVDEISTTFNIPTAGTYDIYAFFWDDVGGASWNLESGLVSGALTNYLIDSPGVFLVDADSQMSGSPTELIGLNVLGQGGDDFLDFIDGNRTLHGAKVGLQSVAANGSVTVYMDHDESLAQRTFFDGVGYTEAQPIPTLEVNTSTGEVKIENTFNVPVDLSYYEIRSASGSLNPSGWNSLDAQNIDAVDGDDAGSVAGDMLLEGWDEAGSIVGDYNGNGIADAADYTVWADGLGEDFVQSQYDDWNANFNATGLGTSEIINETNFLNESTLAPGASYSLGNAFDTSGTQDLVFNFGLVSDGFLSPSAVTETSLAAQVPEPSGLALVTIFACCAFGWRRRIG